IDRDRLADVGEVGTGEGDLSGGTGGTGGDNRAAPGGDELGDRHHGHLGRGDVEQDVVRPRARPPRRFGVVTTAPVSRLSASIFVGSGLNTSTRMRYGMVIATFSPTAPCGVR